MGEAGPKLKDPLIARGLLTFGGVFGLHRLYLEQIPEAFIYFSTFGVFGVGSLLDIFTLHSMVDAYNEKIAGEVEGPQKFKNGRLQPKLSKMVRSSIDKFVFSVAYAMWLGLLVWIAGSVTFGVTLHRSLVMISAVGAAVSSGVYIVGNRGDESRDLLYIWMSTLTTTFLFGMLDTSVFRTLLVSSLVGTVIGNRTALLRHVQMKQYNFKHFVFWSSLFLCLLCLIVLGLSRQILQQRVSVTRVGESTVITSMEQLMADRMADIGRLRRLFDGATKIEYSRAAGSGNNKMERKWWDFDIVGRAPGWADQVVVLIVDILRSETRATVGGIKTEPLQWALWRMYLLLYFDTSPFVSDKTLLKLCERHGRDKDNEKNMASRAVGRACEVMKM